MTKDNSIGLQEELAMLQRNIGVIEGTLGALPQKIQPLLGAAYAAVEAIDEILARILKE